MYRYSLEAKERDGPRATGTKQFKRVLPSDFVRASTVMPLTWLRPAVILAVSIPCRAVPCRAVPRAELVLMFQKFPSLYILIP